MKKSAMGLFLALAVGTARASVTNDVAFIAAHDGSEQRYVRIEPDGFDPSLPHDVLICLHGHGSDRWQYVNAPRGEARAARDAAAQNRMLFISPDYRAKTSWMGPAAEADLLQGVLESLHRGVEVDRGHGAQGYRGQVDVGQGSGHRSPTAARQTVR